MRLEHSPPRMGLNRRALLAVPPLAMLGLLAQRLAGAQTPRMETRGDCLDEPAMKMLLDFQTGNWDRLPFQREEDVLPGIDWVVAETIDHGMLFVPPEWTVLNVWANEFARNGIPEWQAEPLPFPFWNATFIISPDESAAFISVTGSIDAPPFLDGDDCIELARATIMGSDEEGRELCAAQQQQSNGLMGEVLYAFGDRYGSDLFMCRGHALQSEVAGPSLGPGTSFSFDVMVGPRRESEAMMTETYMRILWQMLPKGGGASTPTPTPTPQF